MPTGGVGPHAPPCQSLVCRSDGMKDGSPSIVVLLLSARSAEPPQSSGSTGASALSTVPDALRVAMPLGSGSKVGSASVQPSGSCRPLSRSSSAARSALASRQAWYDPFHSSCSFEPLSTTERACASTSSVTSNVCSGSKPSSRFVAATSSAPRAEPCALPVFCLFGAGQPMIVRSVMNDGRLVSAFAASIAASSASTSSTYWPLCFQSTVCTCQPYAS